MTKYKTTKNKIKASFSKLIDLQLMTQNLPQLPPVEKAKLDQTFAIDQLYYSSKLEGSVLTTEMINKAIHGKTFSAA